MIFNVIISLYSLSHGNTQNVFLQMHKMENDVARLKTAGRIIHQDMAALKYRIDKRSGIDLNEVEAERYELHSDQVFTPPRPNFRASSLTLFF